jgi:hypothetical protein
MARLYDKPESRRRRLITLSFALATTPPDQPLFVAGNYLRLREVREVHSVVAASATLQLRKCASGTAPASGTALLSSTLAADSTVNVPLSGTIDTTAGVADFTPGQFLALDVTGTLTGYQGAITVVFEVY